MKFLSSDKINFKQKRYLLKINEIYLHNCGLKGKEFELYGTDNKLYKIKFELDRIRFRIVEENIGDYELKLSVALLSKNAVINSFAKYHDEKIYDVILNGLIKIEIKLGLNITLFNE